MTLSTSEFEILALTAISMQIMFAGLGGLRTAVGIIADKHLVAVALEMILLAIMHFCGALTEGGSAPPEALLHD